MKLSWTSIKSEAMVGASAKYFVPRNFADTFLLDGMQQLSSQA